MTDHRICRQLRRPWVGALLACTVANPVLAAAPVSGVKTQPATHQQASGFDPIAMDSVVFDTTGGATPGVAWQDGLYHLSGSYLPLGNGSDSQGITRLMINGTAAEWFLFDQQNLWDSQTFSTYLQLNQGDVVSLEVDSAGSYNAHQGNYTNISMLAFNEINGQPTVSGIKTQPATQQQASGYDPIAMDSLVFDTTGGATPGVAWQDGLYHFSGSYLAHGNGSDSQGFARLLVNGTVAEWFLFDQQNFWDSQSFSTYLQLSEGDVVSLEVDSSGPYNAHQGNYTNINMFAFNEINGQPTVSGIKTRPATHQQATGLDPIAMDTVVFDTTGGATPGVAWQDGLYHLSGSYLALGSGSDSQGFARLLVNGTVAEWFLFDQQQNWDSQTFSTYLQLNQGDVVSLEVDSSGSYNAHEGIYTNINMFVFNEIFPVPEPTALALGIVAVIGAGFTRRRCWT